MIYGKTNKQRLEEHMAKRKRIETPLQFFALWPRTVEQGQTAWLCKVWVKRYVDTIGNISRYYTIKKPE